MSNYYFLCYLAALEWNAQAAERAGEAADALHALQPPHLGLGQVGEPRPEALGDWQDHRADVAGPAGGREGGVHGGVRGGQGGV